MLSVEPTGTNSYTSVAKKKKSHRASAVVISIILILSWCAEGACGPNLFSPALQNNCIFFSCKLSRLEEVDTYWPRYMKKSSISE